MTNTLHLDIETYSRVDIRKSNVYRYVEDEHFQILMVGWALNDDPVQVATTPEEIQAIPFLLADEVKHMAHNAAFERVCFSAWAGLPVGQYLSPRQWIDSMVLAAEAGYPKKLEHLAHALGGELKDSAGTALITFFCRPNRKGQRNLPADHPEKWAQFVEYCRQDVVTMRDVAAKLPDLTPEEWEAFYADQDINDRGIAIDRGMAMEAVDVADDNRLLQELEISELTGVANPGSGPQMIAWLRSQGVQVANLQAATVKDLLAGDPSDTVRRVLELRQELALVAAKKFTSALGQVNTDGRLRGSFRFFGAHTGRWAGSGVQLQNLPSATLESETVTEAAIIDLKLGLGADSHTLKALVRAMITGPFTVVDYSAIEARVLAWLAGEEWALDAFSNGRDIYVETAARMGPQYTRKEGKVATLALGYNGGTNSLEAMGAEGSKEQLQAIVNMWRGANENIVNMWREMDAAFRQGDRSVGDHLYVTKDGADRYLQLPSGRSIGYHDLKAKWVEKWGKRVQEVSFADPKLPRLRTATYGGRLTENVTQAVARDILSEALVRLNSLGLPVVGHVHDEILVEHVGPRSVDRISKLMCVQPTWAEGLPLAAEGFTTNRYRKG